MAILAGMISFKGEKLCVMQALDNLCQLFRGHVAIVEQGSLAEQFLTRVP